MLRKSKKLSEDQEILQEERELRREYYIFIPILLIVFTLLAFNFAKPKPKSVVELVPYVGNAGYWLVYENGEVKNFGAAPAVPTIPVAEDMKVVAAQAAANGFWTVVSDGSVSSSLGAEYAGGVDKIKSDFQAGELVAMPNGRAYRILGNNGETYDFNTPSIGGGDTYRDEVAAAASTSQGEGYWLIKKTGEVVAFGDAANFGKVEFSEGAVIVDAASYGNGAIVLLNTGEVYILGDGQDFGDIREDGLKSAVVDVDPLSDNSGYRITQANGNVTDFGSAKDLQTN